MAAIHNIELDLFARTANGEEISLGKVELPITIDVNQKRPPRPPHAALVARAEATKPIPPKFGWPDLPDDKHQIDVMLIVCLEKVGSDVVHIGQVMDEYLNHLENQATLNEGGFTHGGEQ